MHMFYVLLLYGLPSKTHIRAAKKLRLQLTTPERSTRRRQRRVKMHWRSKWKASLSAALMKSNRPKCRPHFMMEGFQRRCTQSCFPFFGWVAIASYNYKSDIHFSNDVMMGWRFRVWLISIFIYSLLQEKTEWRNFRPHDQSLNSKLGPWSLYHRSSYPNKHQVLESIKGCLYSAAEEEIRNLHFPLFLGACFPTGRGGCLLERKISLQ